MNEVYRLPVHVRDHTDVGFLALELQHSLSACATLPEFLHTLSDKLPRLLPARDRVSLAFLEPGGEWMRVYRVLPGFDAPPARLPRVRVDGTVVGQVATDARPRVVGDVWQDPNITFGHASHDGIRSTASVPITIAGRVVGVMNIGSRTPGACHEHMLGELAAVAAIVGPAVFAAERVFMERPATPPTAAADTALVGQSPAFRAAVRAAMRAAATDCPVLITGETGVGKTALARAVHGWSRRSAGPFIGAHMADLAAKSDSDSGLDLASACRGTLFLDEIADAPMALQARLVRLMAGMTTDGAPELVPRIVAATLRDLHEGAEAGTFRKDLLYRLDVLTVHVPPLRERLADLEPLVEAILGRVSVNHGGQLALSPSAWARLRSHGWPGNVRELESVLLRAALMEDHDELTLEHWRPATATSPEATSLVDVTDWPTRDEQERRYLKRVIEHCGGVLEGARGAARRLGMQPSTLRSRMKRLGVTGSVSRRNGGG